MDTSLSPNLQYRIGCLISFVGIMTGVLLGLLLLDKIASFTRSGPLAPSFCGDFSCVEIANYQVRVGDNRDSALQALGSGAWYYGECNPSSATVKRDVFLYGPRHRDRTTLLTMMSEEIDGQLVVSRIGRIDNDRISSTDSCWPGDIWDSDLRKPEVIFMMIGVFLTLASRSLAKWMRTWIRSKYVEMLTRTLSFSGGLLIGIGLVVSLLYAIFA